MKGEIVAVGAAGYDSSGYGDGERNWQSPDLPAPTITTRWAREGSNVGWLLVEVLTGAGDSETSGTAAMPGGRGGGDM